MMAGCRRPGPRRTRRCSIDTYLTPLLGHIELRNLQAVDVSRAFATIREWNEELAAGRRRICGASPQQTEELLTEQAAVARLWIAFRDLDRRTGLNATQKMLSGDMWERVRLFRTYQTKVVPGLLQTAGYMTAVLTAVRHERGVEVDDVADALAERIGRQGYLLQRDRQFVFVIEEPVLWFRPFSVQVQREQRAHLLDVMTLPSVSVSIIPMAAGRHGYRPRESFDITDSDLVTIEMLTGFLSLTHPDEIAAYVTGWGQLYSIAVRGRKARALIRGALAALDEAAGSE